MSWITVDGKYEYKEATCEKKICGHLVLEVVGRWGASHVCEYQTTSLRPPVPSGLGHAGFLPEPLTILGQTIGSTALHCPAQPVQSTISSHVASLLPRVVGSCVE